ncbi:DUF669 domain-containing protein [Mycoplasma sp. Z1473D]
MAINFSTDWEKRVLELNSKEQNKIPAGTYHGEIKDAGLITKEQDGSRYQAVELVVQLTNPTEYSNKTVKKLYILDNAYKYSWRVERDQKELDLFFIELGKCYKDELELITVLFELKKQQTPVAVEISEKNTNGKTYYNVKINSLKSPQSSTALKQANELKNLRTERKNEINIENYDSLFDLV